MAPRLRVLAGTSSSSMTPITSLVNTSRAHYLSSPLFEGRIVVHIKGMTDEKGRVRESEYFERGDPSRAGVTWSIQVQGRFLTPYSADDILFGNTFDRPLKLPWGTSAVLKFMHYIDPTLEHDLTSSSKPWALSPLIATMPHFMHTRLGLGLGPSSDMKLPPFPTKEMIGDDTSELYLALEDFGANNNNNGELEGDGEGEDEVNGNMMRGQTPPLMLVTPPPPTPVLIPGPVPPIPATSRHQSSQSLSLSTVNSTSASRTASRRSSLSVASSSGKRSSRLSVSSASSSTSFSSASSSSSSSSGSGSGSGSGSVVSGGTGSSIKSTRSSGLSSIRMKTKDVVRKVKGKKSASGGAGDDGYLYEARRKKEEELKSLEGAAQRRAYFASRERRKEVIFGPEDVITTDFCYGFISFAPSLALQLPGGLSFDLMKYWDGQPVRFVCCERPGVHTSRYGSTETNGDSKDPWGRIFWCVAIEIVDSDDDDDEGAEEEEEE